MVDYKSLQPNSHKFKEDSKEKHLQRIAKGRVITKKRSFGEKLGDMFIADTPEQSIGQFVLYDILVPTIKETIADIVTRSVEMLFYGSSGKPRRYGNGSIINYGSYSSGNRSTRPANYANPRMGRQYEHIIFESRADAEETLDMLCELISQYGSVSISDLNELAGLQSNGYTDQYYGWTNLAAASVMRVRENGQTLYTITLPRAVDLK